MVLFAETKNISPLHFTWSTSRAKPPMRSAELVTLGSRLQVMPYYLSFHLWVGEGTAGWRMVILAPPILRFLGPALKTSLECYEEGAHSSVLPQQF